MRHVANTGRLVFMEIGDFLPLVRAIHIPVLLVDRVNETTPYGQFFRHRLRGRMAFNRADIRDRNNLLRAALPPAMIGLIAGIDNTAAALAIGALMFTGTLSDGMGLGVGVVLLGGALLALVVAVRSVQPNSVALVQESTIAVVAAAIASMAVQSVGDPQAKIATAIVIIGASSIVTGVLFWVTGKLKLGGLVRYLPYPVMAGFLAGSGWLLVNGASVMLTGHDFGLEFAQSLSELQVLWRVLPAVGLALVMFVALSRTSHPATMPLIMIAALVGFNLVLGFTGVEPDAVRDLGHLPAINVSGGIELPTLQLLARVDWSAVLAATPIMLVIAGLSMIGLMLNVSGLELAMRRDIDVNAELRSTGLANVLSGSVGGPSGYVGLSMTVLAQKTGATSRGAGIATAIAMLLGLFFAGHLIFQVPIFLTAGFVLFLGIGLLKEWFVDARQSMPMSEWLVVVGILLTVALVGFMEGLALGLLVSSALFIFKYSLLPVVRFRATGVEQRSSVDRSPTAIKYLSEHGDAIEIIQLQGYIFFGTADRIVNLVRRRLATKDKPPLQFVVLDFQNVSGADSAAIACFMKIARLAEDNNVNVSLTRLADDLRHNLTLAGIELGENQLISVLHDIDRALERAEETLLSEHLDVDGEKSLLKHFVLAIGDHPRLPALIDNMTRLELQPDDVLIRQGEDANDVFFVASGRVRVQLTLPNGDVMRVRTMLAGAIVGEIALYLKQPRIADVIVDAPSEIFQLSAADLVRMQTQDPELAAIAHQLLASNLSEKLSVANKMIQLTQK